MNYIQKQKMEEELHMNKSGKWGKAEKDFLDSLEAKPDQAYVINYLAYSWIEKGIKIKNH